NVDVQRLIAATQSFCIAVHGGLDTRISAVDLPNVGARFVSTAGEAFSDAICGRRLGVVESLRSVGYHGDGKIRELTDDNIIRIWILNTTVGQGSVAKATDCRQLEDECRNGDWH